MVAILTIIPFYGSNQMRMLLDLKRLLSVFLPYDQCPILTTGSYFSPIGLRSSEHKLIADVIPCQNELTLQLTAQTFEAVKACKIIFVQVENEWFLPLKTQTFPPANAQANTGFRG
jgi:hypothetical protein